MAKFSVFFNDNPIHSATFESGVVHIRRDESNDLYINSLAFVPAHAAVILRGTENIIKQLNADFPLIINGDRQSKHHLKNGDVIIIGKHHIVFNTVETTSLDSLPTANKKPEQERHATSRNSGTPVALIRSPTQRMGDALNALVSLSLIYLISCQYIKEHVNLWTS